MTNQSGSGSKTARWGDEESTLPETNSASWNELQAEAIKRASHNFLYLALMNTYSNMVIFAFHLISLETLISIGLSVGCAVYAYLQSDEESFDGSIMNWVLLSFAVITPISSALSMAFSRRERALDLIALIRSSFIELYVAHAIWDRGTKMGNGYEKWKKPLLSWSEHADSILEEILGICEDLSRFLVLPTSTRARHKITSAGRNEAKETGELASELTTAVVLRFGRIAELGEVLKRDGLPPTEAARMRQWERLLLESVEKLRMIKRYRTPQALRSFARLFSIFLPAFYAPFYAQMARELNSLGTAVAFSSITSLALTALFETVSQMEDPFVRTSVLDGIHVERELIGEIRPRLLALRGRYFPALPKARDDSGRRMENSDAISVASIRSMRFLLE